MVIAELAALVKRGVGKTVRSGGQQKTEIESLWIEKDSSGWTTQTPSGKVHINGPFARNIRKLEEVVGEIKKGGTVYESSPKTDKFSL